MTGKITEAVQWCLEKKIDVVICDIRMPGGGGVELLAELKMKNISHIHVYLISAFSDVGPSKAVLLGARALIPKPFVPNEILTMIESEMI